MGSDRYSRIMGITSCFQHPILWIKCDTEYTHHVLCRSYYGYLVKEDEIFMGSDCVLDIGERNFYII